MLSSQKQKKINNREKKQDMNVYEIHNHKLDGSLGVGLFINLSNLFFTKFQEFSKSSKGKNIKVPGDLK